MEIEIRKVGMKEHSQIQKLCHELCKKESREFDKTLLSRWPYTKEGIKYHTGILKSSKKCAFIAYADGKPVGYITGEIMKRIEYRKPIIMARLDEFFIREKYRSKGIGKKLNDALIKWCKEEGTRRIQVAAYAENNQGINFYRKNGFSDYTLYLEKKI